MTRPTYSLGTAARLGDVKRLRRLLAEGADPNAAGRYYDGHPPLFWTVQGNHPEAARMLLEAGADPWAGPCPPYGVAEMLLARPARAAAARVVLEWTAAHAAAADLAAVLPTDTAADVRPRL